MSVDRTHLVPSVEDTLFSAALSCVPMESTLITEAGTAFAVRLVNLPVPCSEAVELLWRCRYAVTRTDIIPHSERYPDDIGEAVVWAAALEKYIKHDRLTKPLDAVLQLARKWDDNAREELIKLLNKPNKDHVNIVRRLSIKPFPPGWQTDPLHVYRMYLLKASSEAENPPGTEVFSNIGDFFASSDRNTVPRRPNQAEISRLGREFARQNTIGGIQDE